MNEITKFNEEQIKKLNYLIDYYLENFYSIHEKEHEGYKWEAVLAFQNTKGDLFDKLKSALNIGNNLVGGYTRSTLNRLIEKDRDKMAFLFLNLAQGYRTDIKTRLREFISESAKLCESKWSHLDSNITMTCLALYKPDEYFIYRPVVMDEISMYFYGYTNKESGIEKAYKFHQICCYILNHIESHRADLIEYYKKNNPYYYLDRQYHLLVQNLLYILHYDEFKKRIPIPSLFSCIEIKDKLVVCDFKKSRNKNSVKAGKFNIEDEYDKMLSQSKIGKRGEIFIFEELRQKYGDSVIHVSEISDNYHYDILVDGDEKKFIEVKTISFKNQRLMLRIYITQSEVQFSIDNSDEYYLVVVLLEKETYRKYVFKGAVTDTLKLQYSKNGDRYVVEFDLVK